MTDSSDPDAAAQYDIMLHVVEDCCIELLAVQIEKLQFGLPFKTGFEKNYEFESHKVNKTGRKKPLVIYRDYFIHDPLYWSLGCIGWDEHRPFTMDPVFNIRVLEHCMSKGAKSDRQRLDQATYDQIDDIAVIDEIRFAVRCNTSRNRKHAVVELKRMLKAPERTNYIKKVKNVSFGDINIGLRGTLRDVMQPSWPTGPKNETWLAQADQCRANLSRFWTRFRGLYRTQQIKAGFAEDFIQAEIDVVSADLSERFVAEVRDARNAILNKSGSVGAQRSLPHDLATTSVPRPQIYDQKENVQIGPMRHTKVKTRGKAKDESMPVSVLPLKELEVPASVAPVQVARDNLLVFKQMFPSDDEHFTRKLSWQHFCAAMVDAGFAMTQGSGSAVSFKQSDTFHPSPASGASGSIVFHRPHPDSSIDPIMLRSFGKRLEKWFGWSRELFVERVKREGEAPA
ncbi:hypothetical protein BDZ85DRAFT_266197 [Elsinoe ampelina]|uniref:Uncharacterized protein n=1 Tax=Elsinoe ampelina TaxID=302913 RepID=A0A6A6G6K8_9PEZI|nr:hypothetical protein BDZ85DRAFT_266197 [Elsinoe ampelina]